MRSLLLALALVGCVDESVTTSPTSPNLLRDDGKADDGMVLWAGLTSQTFSRYAPDPCNDGRTELVDVVHYDDYVRQRATIRNVCFEVWSPGITDWENPDFWRQLDVQVHYRFGDGAYQHAYVNSIDRRGNNRRYAWSVSFGFDPFGHSTSLASIQAPLTILSETETSAFVQADLDFYFTVNGRVLNTNANRDFAVEFTGYTSKPTLVPDDNGYVLHDIVTCEGGKVRFGSGAGFFAADIRVPAVVATLGKGLDGSMIYGVPTARGTENLSFTYGTQTTVAGQALPGFNDGAGLRIVPNGTSMVVELDAYDRAAGKTTTLTATVSGCSL